MIIYLAGASAGVRKMPHRKQYEHVLFSKALYVKRDFEWLKRRKERELKNETK